VPYPAAVHTQFHALVPSIQLCTNIRIMTINPEAIGDWISQVATKLRYSVATIGSITDGNNPSGYWHANGPVEREESNWAIQPFAFKKLAQTNSSILIPSPYRMRLASSSLPSYSPVAAASASSHGSDPL
jgi:hypothetical protein